MNMNEIISEVADLIVYAAQADGIEDHAIEDHATNARIRSMVESPIPYWALTSASDAFCQDVRDQIATILGKAA